MKKQASTLTNNKTLLAGVFLAGVLITTLFMSVYDKPNQLDQQASSSQSYGSMGYGRGNGQQSGDRQGMGTKNGSGQELTKQNCLMDGCLLVDDAEYPVGELDQQTIDYLEFGLADERKALATYEAVMDEFGKVRPFVNIARAEEQHIAMLKALFDKYGLDIPADDTQVGALPATLSEVCAVGVQAEIDNDQLYQDMIPNIKEEDIKDVMTALADASREMHLPAFQRCAN